MFYEQPRGLPRNRSEVLAMPVLFDELPLQARLRLYGPMTPPSRFGRITVHGASVTGHRVQQDNTTQAVRPEGTVLPLSPRPRFAGGVRGKIPGGQA